MSTVVMRQSEVVSYIEAHPETALQLSPANRAALIEFEGESVWLHPKESGLTMRWVIDAWRAMKQNHELEAQEEHGDYVINLSNSGGMTLCGDVNFAFPACVHYNIYPEQPLVAAGKGASRPPETLEELNAICQPLMPQIWGGGCEIVFEDFRFCCQHVDVLVPNHPGDPCVVLEVEPVDSLPDAPPEEGATKDPQKESLLGVVGGVVQGVEKKLGL